MSAPITRAVRAARRRLFLQALLNRLAAGWAVALLAALGWLLAEPWLFDAPPPNLKWVVAGGCVLAATLAAIILAVRAMPSAFAAALELDARFGLKERVTTALGLRPHEIDTPAGSAVVADAAERVSPLAVRSKFPVGVPRRALAVPTLAGALALAAVFYHPNTARTEAADPTVGPKPAAPVPAASPDPKKPAPDTKPKPADRSDRTDKSEKLKDLEAEIERTRDKHLADPDREKPEKQKEKVADLTALEDKLKKFNDEKIDKLARAEQQLRELNKLNKDPEFADGPAKEMNDALAKGDLKKAKDAVDELAKKARDKKLDKADEEKLAKQLERMKEQMERLDRNKEREEKLKDLIDKAKKEGRNAEALERELNDLKQEAKESGQALEELAQRLEKARSAAEKGDLEQLANELEAAAQELKNMDAELKDIEDAAEYLQRLKGEKAEACKKCGGDGKCKGMGEGDTDEWNNGGIGAGRRPENKDAQTSSADERIRGLFDPRGKKSYGGSTKGQAFNKRTTADLGTEIREAVQEAPQAADGQRLPRDARDAVREYFQNLGGQAPGGK
jgi:uncharacterized coiled-coil DUF342 family protein